MTVRDVLESVALRFNDTDYVRFTSGQYLKFLDDTILRLIQIRPDAHTTTAVVDLVAGSRQTIPDTGFSLIDIFMNKSGSAGSWTSGTPILQVAREDLDYFNSWHTAEEITEIDEFAYDLRNPRVFWVAPAPATAGTVHVEMVYSSGVDSYANDPDDFATVLEKTIPMEDIYRSVLISGMLSLCFSADSASATDRAVAQQYEQQFLQSLGLEYEASRELGPEIHDEVS